MDIQSPFASPVENRIRFLVQASSLPASIVESIDVPYFGRKIKVHGDRVFQDWEVTIMNDQSQDLRNLFLKWHNEINTIVSNKLATDLYATGYKQTATVTHFNTEGDQTVAFTFQGLFPVQVSGIGLDWNQTNTIEQFSVTFAYDYWEPILQPATDQYSITTPDDGVIGNAPRTN